MKIISQMVKQGKQYTRVNVKDVKSSLVSKLKKSIYISSNLLENGTSNSIKSLHLLSSRKRLLINVYTRRKVEEHG